MKNIAFLTLLSLLLFSCVAYQSGGITSSSSGPNFVYEDLAIGSAMSNRAFGLGGMRKDALILEAKRQLMTSRPLQQGEEYINFTIDFKRAFFPIIDRTKVTISADVIRYTENSPESRYSEIYKEKMFQVNLNYNLFKVGDYILTENHLSGQILSINKKLKATISLKNSNGEIITKKRYLTDLYNRTASRNGLKAGESFPVSNMGKKIECEIVGLGITKMLLKTAGGNYITIEYLSLTKNQNSK